MDEDLTTETQSGYDGPVRCALCGCLQASGRVEWWTDTTPWAEPLETPVQVCRDVSGCATRARLQTFTQVGS